MDNHEIKVIAVGAALLILIGRLLLRLRGLQGDARTHEMRKSLSGGLLPIAVMAGLLLYFLLARA